MKAEHIRLADYAHLFTEDFIGLALSSLKNPDVQRPSFMHKFPGIFRKGKHEFYLSLEYVDSEENIARTIVPQSKREALLNTLWSRRVVPRGQESFQQYINKRFIGVQARFIRDFVGRQPAMQMIRDLKNVSKNTRAVRSKIPFSHISCDLADFISFSQRRGEDEERFVFLLCDDFSGYLFARILPLGKDGLGVSKAYQSVLKSILKLGGKPRILTSDLGGEFFNKHFQAVCVKYDIKHIKPKTGARIAPYIENRVRHFKRYVRLNSHLLFKNTRWYEPEILRDSAKAVNNIQRDSGKSAKEIVQLWKKGGSLTSIHESYQKNEQKEDTSIGVGTIASGDFVRTRVAKQKIGLDHKSHLGFRGDSELQIPVSWSTTIYRVLKTKNMRLRRTIRYMLNNKLWYDRNNLLKIPANTEKLTRMPRSIVDKIQKPGKRSSRLVGKKRISYKE